MIEWLTPTVVGSMNFGATSNADLGGGDLGSGGGVTSVGAGQTIVSINQTGTTEQSSFAWSRTTFVYATIVTGTLPDTGLQPITESTTTESAGGGSGSTQATLRGQTTTTVTAEGEYTLLTTIALQDTQWTTSSSEDASIVFTTQTYSTTTLATTRGTRQSIETSVIEETQTSVGNTYATVYLGDYLAPSFLNQEVINTGNELAIGLNSNVYLSTWNGLGVEASPYLTTGIQITVKPDIDDEAVNIVDLSTPNQTAILNELTAVVSYESTTAVTAETITYNYNFFPPKSFAAVTLVTNVESVESAWTIRPAQTVIHKDNLAEITTFASSPKTTAMEILRDGQTYSRIRGEAPPYASFTQYSLAPTFETFVSPTNAPTITVSAAGNTTYRKDGALKLLGGNRLFLPEVQASLDMGACFVVKPCGASLGDSFGSFFTANSPEFPVASSEVYAFKDRQADEDGNIGLNERQFQFFGGEGIRLLQTVQNDSFTIENSSIVWTTTTSANQTTQATTQSAPIGVSGEPQTRLVATKSVLGGRPEEFATFYNTAPVAVYKDVSGQSFIAGENATIITNGDTNTETTQLRQANYLTHFGFETIVAERHPIPFEGANKVLLP